MDKEPAKKISSESSKALNFLQDKDICYLFKPNFEKFFNKFLNTTTDNYVFHSQINIGSMEEKSLIFLTKTQIVITQVFGSDSEDGKNIPEEEFKENPILFKIDYCQVVSQEIEECDEVGNKLIIQYMDYDALKQTQKIIDLKICFKNLPDAFLSQHVITKYSILYWQKFFESGVLDRKEQVYNHHFFIKKVGVFGKVQHRILLITNKFIYNLKFEYIGINLKIEKVKWSDAISAIVVLEKCDKKTLDVVVKYDPRINKIENDVENNKIKSKTERTFSFKSMKDKSMFIFAVRRNFFNLKNIYLEIK